MFLLQHIAYIPYIPSTKDFYSIIVHIPHIIYIKIHKCICIYFYLCDNSFRNFPSFHRCHSLLYHEFIYIYIYFSTHSIPLYIISHTLLHIYAHIYTQMDLYIYIWKRHIPNVCGNNFFVSLSHALSSLSHLQFRNTNTHTHIHICVYTRAQYPGVIHANTKYI